MQDSAFQGPVSPSIGIVSDQLAPPSTPEPGQTGLSKGALDTPLLVATLDSPGYAGGAPCTSPQTLALRHSFPGSKIEVIYQGPGEGIVKFAAASATKGLWLETLSISAVIYFGSVFIPLPPTGNDDRGDGEPRNEIMMMYLITKGVSGMGIPEFYPLGTLHPELLPSGKTWDEWVDEAKSWLFDAQCIHDQVVYRDAPQEVAAP